VEEGPLPSVGVLQRPGDGQNAVDGEEGDSDWDASAGNVRTQSGPEEPFGVADSVYIERERSLKN